MSKFKDIKKIIISLMALLLLVIALGSQASAQKVVNISLVAGYAQGHNNFNVVVKDTPGTQLVIYVNDKNPSKATVNKSDYATFQKVSFVNTGKISFTIILTNASHKSYQQPINYVRYYRVSNGKLKFLVSKPTTTKSTSTSTAKKAQYIAYLYNIDNNNVNTPMTRPDAGWDANDGWDTEAQANIDNASTDPSTIYPAVIQVNSHEIDVYINVKNNGKSAGTPRCTATASADYSAAPNSQQIQDEYYGYNSAEVYGLYDSPIDAGGYGNAIIHITITNQGAQYINKISISC